MTRRARFAALCGICSLLLLGAGAPASGEDVKVRAVAGVASTSTIPANVKRECSIQQDLSAAVAAHSGENVELVSKKPGSGLYLDLVITDVHAPGGGIFSGPKWIEARGKLSRGGKQVRSFRVKRITSGPGAGTCGMLAKVTNAMGKDIAGWLANENAGSLLGDAQ